MTRVVGSFARAIITAGILGALAAPLPVAIASPNQFAQATPAPAALAPTAQPAPAPSTTAQPAPAQPAQASQGATGAAAKTTPQLVEMMIADMRTRLRITAAEQSQFDAVADAMRLNAKEMEALLAARSKDSDQSAPASLHWYERLTETHVALVKNFIPAFATLYASLSASQRKAADALFLRFGERPFMPPRSR